MRWQVFPFDLLARELPFTKRVVHSEWPPGLRIHRPALWPHIVVSLRDIRTDHALAMSLSSDERLNPCPQACLRACAPVPLAPPCEISPVLRLIKRDLASLRIFELIFFSPPTEIKDGPCSLAGWARLANGVGAGPRNQRPASHGPLAQAEPSLLSIFRWVWALSAPCLAGSPNQEDALLQGTRQNGAGLLCS